MAKIISVRINNETEKKISEIQINLKKELNLDENISDIIRVSIEYYHEKILEIKSNKSDTS